MELLQVVKMFTPMIQIMLIQQRYSADTPLFVLFKETVLINAKLNSNGHGNTNYTKESLMTLEYLLILWLLNYV